MVYVLSSPENAGGFFVTGSMDWKGRTQECSSRPAVQFAGPLPSPVTKERGFRGIVPLKQSLSFDRGTCSIVPKSFP